MLEQLIRDAYDQMAAADQPPARISIPQAIRQARSRRRRRWLSAVGPPALAASAALVVALIAAIPPIQLSSRPRRPAATETTQRAPGAPRQFNPLVPYAAFGWLPAGDVPGSGQSGRTEDSLNGGHGHPAWQLSVYARGLCSLRQRVLSCQDGVNALVRRGPSVRGHRAYWSGMYLAWQYARGGWAVLNALHSHNKVQPAYLEVASRVTFGAGTQPIEFNVQLTKVPAAWQVAAVAFQHEAGVLVAQSFWLGRGAAAVPVGADVTDLPFFDAGTAARGGCYFYPGGQSAHRVLGGYPVIVTVIPAAAGRPPSYQVCAKDAAGLWVFVGVNGWHPVIGAVTVFQQLRILGTNRSTWTTQPIAR